MECVRQVELCTRGVPSIFGLGVLKQHCIKFGNVIRFQVVCREIRKSDESNNVEES